MEDDALQVLEHIFPEEQRGRQSEVTPLWANKTPFMAADDSIDRSDNRREAADEANPPGISSSMELTQKLLGKQTPLGRPVILGDGTVVVCTIQPRVLARLPPDNFVCAIRPDTNAFRDQQSPWEGAERPVCLNVETPLLDLIAVGENTLLGAAGNTLVTVHAGDSRHLRVTELAGITFPDDLRQLALRPGQHQVGAVGFDRTFTLCDLAMDGAPVQTCRTHGPVSSLRWDEVDSRICTWTTDNGALEVYDTRENRVVQRFLEHPDMYSHELVGGVGFLAGYGNGTVQLIRPGVATQDTPLEDPVLQAVGDIHRQGTSSDFLVTGIGGLSLWRCGASHDPSNGGFAVKAALAMDGNGGTALPEGGLFGTEAAWMDAASEGLVAFTTEEGRIGILDADEWRRISSTEDREGVCASDDAVPFATSMSSIPHQRTGSRDMLMSSSGSLARLLDAASRDMPVAGSDPWWDQSHSDAFAGPPRLDHDVSLDGLDQAWMEPFPESLGAEDPTWGSGESLGLGVLHGDGPALGSSARRSRPTHQG